MVSPREGVYSWRWRELPCNVQQSACNVLKDRGAKEKLLGTTIKKGKERAAPYQAARTPICRSTTCSYRNICLSCHGSYPGSSSWEAT